MSDELAKLRAEQDRINAMPGRTAWVKLARLRRTARILVGNASVLRAHLQGMQDPAVLLRTMSDQRVREEFLDETERHLHNYLAAAQSRVDHFRQFVRAEWPEGSQPRQEYEQRLDREFKTAPLHNFIIRLRQLILQSKWVGVAPRTLGVEQVAHPGQLGGQAEQLVAQDRFLKGYAGVGGPQHWLQSKEIEPMLPPPSQGQAG